MEKIKQLIDNNQCDTEDFKTNFFNLSDEEKIRCINYIAEKFDSEFYNKLKNDMNFKAKVIAAYVRYNIEDFHCKYLNDEQMKELNPLIRNAIYTALKHIDENPIKVHMVAQLNLPQYWEDCQLINT